MTLPKLRFLLFLLSSFGLLLSPFLSFADDYSNNIGFMKNPPKELKEKFPKCDQFLDVNWIKQFPLGNWVGTVTVDVYMGSSWEQLKKIRSKEQKKLVVMQRNYQWSSFIKKERLESFDVTDSTIKDKALESLIKSADQAYSVYYSPGSDMGRRAFAVETNGKCTEVSKIRGYSIRGMGSFSKFSQNICVILPATESAWLIETNNPFWIGKPTSDSDETKIEQFKALAAKECSRPNNEVERSEPRSDFCSLCSNGASLVRDSFVLEDVDGDGRMDYRYDKGIVSIVHPSITIYVL